MQAVASEINKLGASSFFWKSSKFNLDFQNGGKNQENVFSFWDNSMWMGCIKLSLLGREHLSTALIVLTKRLKFLISLKETFCKSIPFPLSNKYGKGVVAQI